MKLAAMKAGITEEALNRIIPRVHELPFDARRKRMTTIHREMNQEIAFVKGAPDLLLERCARVLMNGESRELASEEKRVILDTNATLASRASTSPRGALWTVLIRLRSASNGASAIRG